MKNLLIVFFALAIIQCHSQPLNKLDSSAFFDFWVGEWVGTWKEGDAMGKATNRIEKILNGSVIQENFEVIEGQSKGFLGTSISVFNPGTKVWKQAWADNQGGYFDFTGQFDGDKRIFQTVPKERNGQVVVQRMVFYDIKKKRMTWDWEGSKDGGDTWQLNWRINYERVD